MSSKNVNTLRSAHEAFSRGDFETATSLVAANVVHTDHGRNAVFTGPAAFRGWRESPWGGPAPTHALIPRSSASGGAG